MKKFLCVFLSVVMTLSLCLALVGCTPDNPDDIRGDVVKTPTENKDSTEDKKPTENTTPSQKETEPDFSMGESTGSTYKNDFLGLSCTLPEGWIFYTDEQIKEMNNIVGDYMDENVAEQLKNAQIIYDMQAQYLADNSTVGVNMEKLSALQLISLNIQEILESQIPAIQDTYSQMGFTDVKAEYKKITVDGKEFDGMTLSAKIQGVADFAMVIFTFRKGTYLANVSVGTMQTDKLETLLGYFKIQ